MKIKSEEYKKKNPAGLGGGFLDTKKWVKKINTHFKSLKLEEITSIQL